MNRFRGKLVVIFGLCLSMVLLNCESNSTNPTENIDANVPAGAVGNWDAGFYVITNTSNPVEQVDLIQEGLNLSLTIQANGNYSSTLTFPSDPSETETGRLTFVNNIVTVDPSDDDPFPMTYVLTDSILTLVDSNSSFDFDDDGMDEPASETIILVRQ